VQTDRDRRRCVVVGGGVIGCATAYFLARAGLQVIVIERDAVAAHASGRNAGNLNPLYETPAQLVPLTLEAFRLHRALLAELSRIGCASYQLHPADRIHLGCTEAELRELQNSTCCFAHAAGFSSHLLNAHQLREIEPGLADRFIGGLKISGNLSIDSAGFACSLARGAELWGATILHETVEGVLTLANRVTHVRTGVAVVPCDDVVFATGPWVACLGTWLGTAPPIEAVKGELLLMRVAEGAAPRHDLHWGSTALYVRGHNQVLVGGTQQRSGLDSSPTEEAKGVLLQGAAQVLPGMRHAAIESHFAALRPVSASSLPIAERVAQWDNVFIANGGGIKGVLLSVAIARMIHDLLLAPGAHSKYDPFPWDSESEVSSAASLH